MNLYKVWIKFKNVSFLSFFFVLIVVVWVVFGKIYLFESFMLYRKKIVNKVNEMWNDGLILSVWIMDGKIFIKMLFEGRFIKINELDDLDYF